MAKENIHIVALSDIHGIPQHTKVPQCDVVTLSGDFSPLQKQSSVRLGHSMCKWIKNKFIPWMMSLPCERVVLIGGNHDFVTEQEWFDGWFRQEIRNAGAEDKVVYLCNSTYEYKGWVFYGCPYSDIVNWAWSAEGDYTVYGLPEGVDIALYHQSPDYMYLGTSHFGSAEVNYGSVMMMNALGEHPERLPKLLLCGHIHTGEHIPKVLEMEGHRCTMANVSTKNEEYDEYFMPRHFVLTEDDGVVDIDTWV
jgi:hypothetical protein